MTKTNKNVSRKQTYTKKSNIVNIYGKHSVESAIKNPERLINKILCSQDNFDHFDSLCKENDKKHIEIKVVDKREITNHLTSDATHQGVMAQAKPLELYSIEEVCALANNKENCNVIILDQVTDPHNVGAIIRSAAAFGTLAVILTDKNSPNETGSMCKTSAGTIEYMPVCKVLNLARALDVLKKAGFWTIGMDGHAKQTVSSVNKAGKNAIVMGSEGKGMRRLTEENCDITIKLPMAKNVESLNVSTAASIVLYEFSKDLL